MKEATEEQIEKAYKIILERAKTYNPIYYADLYNEVGFDCENLEDRLAGAAMLEEVNEHYSKEYLLTAFVVSKGGNGPFEGFYSLAEEWGLIEEGLSNEEKFNFWVNEMRVIRDIENKV